MRLNPKEEFMEFPSFEEIKKGILEYEKHIPKDQIYKLATHMVDDFWGKYDEMSIGLGILLLTWNKSLYIEGKVDFDDLENCIERNIILIEKFRKRNITSLDYRDDEEIKKLFIEFYQVLRNLITEGRIKRSPAAVSRMLNLLAPDFFPLWNKKIAEGYKFNYENNPEENYLRFCYLNKELVTMLEGKFHTSQKTILKGIDEYNYSKFTKEWI